MNNIALSINDYQAKIILSKPPLNIFDVEDLESFSCVLDKIKHETDIKVITIESAQKAFSAGVNISDHSRENISRTLRAFHNIFFKMLYLEVPTISLVKSACIGGGCELALFCDFALASQEAYFSQPEIKLGCYPPVSLVYLPYIAGHKKSLEMILTANKLSAREAMISGLVNHVFPEEKFDTEAQKFVDSITSNSPSVIKTTLKAYKRLHYHELRKKLEFSENIYLEKLMQLEDAQEGIRSFLEKRPPVWTGR